MNQAAKINMNKEDNPLPEESMSDLKNNDADPTLIQGNDDADEDDDLLNKEELNQMINPIIFCRGVKNDSFYLILSGKVMICSGNEGFFLEQGAFNYMGIDCILNDNYVPDFSAKIIGKAKLLKISREDYRRCMSHVQNNLRSLK